MEHEARPSGGIARTPALTSTALQLLVFQT